ncbi:hypothetical protein [Olleya namhaensis]|uniref:RiboL-PSP-HEPN domain-containing protein n=1 Tax=Olleya namhaensis TaxID=1144750 RepID=A0A1I3TD32_9FLAO|nr:hypothetical protein [Olleya namhaensis]SFJ67641.1 hypothetical protein SAMN05443431_1183 [Olleya namhaensis]
MYREHCKNLSEVENGIKRIELELRKYISINDVKNEYTFTKILSQLIVCWSEVRILKLIYENNAFTEAEINSILLTNNRANSLETKWKKALNISICKAYNITDIGNIQNELSADIYYKYNEIFSSITNDFLPSIQIRNRIAHGQWKVAFTSKLQSISPDLTNKISIENIVSLQLKKKILNGLALLIHDLAVSPPTFERDFMSNYAKIKNNKNNLHKRSYIKYKNQMIAKYQRGKIKRKELPIKLTFFEKIKFVFSKKQ